MPISNNVILDCSEEIHAFKHVVCGLDMPTVDLDCTLQLIFEALKIENAVSREIYLTACDMSEGEGLFENSELDNGASSRIFTAVETLGHQLKNKLSDLHAYVENQFPYEFRSLINDSLLILQYAPPEISD